MFFFQNNYDLYNDTNLYSDTTFYNINDIKKSHCVYHLPTDLMLLLDNPFDDLEKKANRKLITSVEYFKKATLYQKKISNS